MQFLAGLQIELVDHPGDRLRRCRTQRLGNRPQCFFAVRRLDQDQARRIEAESVEAVPGKTAMLAPPRPARRRQSCPSPHPGRTGARPSACLLGEGKKGGQGTPRRSRMPPVARFPSRVRPHAARRRPSRLPADSHQARQGRRAGFCTNLLGANFRLQEAGAAIHASRRRGFALGTECLQEHRKEQRALSFSRSFDTLFLAALAGDKGVDIRCMF